MFQQRSTRAVAVIRHKYLLVIGSVLIVNVLFLIPYSAIQLLSLMHINELIILPHSPRVFLQVSHELIKNHALSYIVS